MLNTENFKFSPHFAEFFGHDLGVQVWPTSASTSAVIEEIPSSSVSFASEVPDQYTAAASAPALAEEIPSRSVFFSNEVLDLAAASVVEEIPSISIGRTVSEPRTDSIRHGLSGFGRRNSLLLIYVAAVVEANREKIKAKGLHLHFSIYEMQRETEAGSGYSCQTTCDGALNTGIPGKVNLSTAGVNPAIAELTNLAQSITAELQKDIPGHTDSLAATNLSALMLFAAAVHEGKIDPTEAFTSRGAIGKIQQPKIELALKYIEDNLKEFITFERFFEHKVVGLVVTNPQKPKLRVQKMGSSVVQEVDFDFVHLANGTPWAPPVGSVPSLTVSSDSPNYGRVKKFLEINELLDLDGRIKSGRHIGITGLSLSAYDYVPLVLQCTSIIEATETGYKIHPEYAASYQGLLSFVSRTGVPTPPRIINYFTSRKPILTTEELHTLSLQKQFDWLNFWTVFLDANVARSLGILPKDLQYRKKMDAKARMIDYARQTEAYLRGELTEMGLVRGGSTLAYGGQGFYASLAEAQKAETELVKKAPLTRTDRAGFLLRRGSLAEVTSPSYIDHHSNKAFFDTYTTFYSRIAASPPAIHYLVARMFELGVAVHVAGDSAEVLPSLKMDVLLAPNVLDRRNDEVLVSLRNNVKELVSGQPDYAKGRFLRTLDEKELVHAIDMGMGGQGTRVSHLDDHESIVGMRWPDTAAVGSAVYDAANLAPITVLLSSIAQTDNLPAKRLLEYYKDALPSKADFDEEVAQFKPIWKEIHEKHAFLQLCEDVAKNAGEYLELTSKVFASATREEVVNGLVTARKHLAATDKYHKAVARTPAFAPPSVEDYFERFVDFSPSEIKRCWDAHMKV